MEQLSVNLALDIIYVYGTVNGAEADFALTAPGVWSAVVPRSEDGVYTVSVTAYNSLGTPTTYETTLYRASGLLQPKTDWARDDYYNAEDLNRVEINTQYLADELTLAGYQVRLEQVIADRDMTHFEFASSLSRVERSIDALAAAFIAPPGYQEPRVWAALDTFDYRDANRLERNLQLLYDWLVAAMASFRRAGAFACGEGGEIY